MQYSQSINNLIDALKKLPSVGQRTAERFVFYWLKNGKKDVNKLRDALDNLLLNTKSCQVCWNFDDINPCRYCQSPKREHRTICVVADPQDIPAIERTGEYSGVYHVLRGTINAGEENPLENTKVSQLLNRIKADKMKKEINEIILALNPDLSGEITMLYITREIHQINPLTKITRLARGLPMGSDLKYADEITLSSALKNRMEK